VTSPTGGPVNEGTVTFTIGNLPSVQASVNGAGVATATFLLPANFAAGTYSVNASYSDTINANGTINFGPSNTSANPGQLVINTAGTQLSVNTLIVGFNASAQQMTLTAKVTSPNGGAVNEGTVTFTVAGQTLSAGVSNGVASAVLVLPGGFASGTFPIVANYTDALNGNGVANYGGSGATGDLVVAPAASATSITSVQLATGAGGLVETITAQVSGPIGPVNAGVVTFNVAGTSVQGSVSNGIATASLTVTSAQAGSTQSITATFGGGGNLAASTQTRNVFLNGFSSSFPTTVTIHADGSQTVTVDLFFLPLVYQYNSSGVLTSAFWYGFLLLLFA
jgi:hypothetical protein